MAPPLVIGDTRRRNPMTTPPAIEFEVHSANAAIVTLRGEHDLNSKAEVAKALSAASAYDNVVVDLSECSFLDSSVISALLHASNRLSEREGLLRLVIAGDGHAGVRRLFEVMDLQRVLPIHSSRAVAIAGLATRPPRTDETIARMRSLDDLIRQSCDDDEDENRAA